MKIISVVGARPQFVKVAVVSRELRSMGVREIIVHTGQHYDETMSNIFFEELMISYPDYNLDVGSGSHGHQTGEMLKRIETVLIDEKPDLVIVFGDTNSTVAGALAASKMNIPVAHVEAGLRSYRRTMPEEINRVVTDHISDYLFCPTQTAVDNLLKEGITRGVYNVGDVMYDAVVFYAEKSASSAVLDTLKLKPKCYCLATIHRAENTDDPGRLQSILAAFSSIPETVVLPLHPRTKKIMSNNRIVVSDSVRIVDPVSYLDMLQLEKNAKAVLTDSGGVQKEAYFLRVPCITLRDETEWAETVRSGWNVVAGIKTEAILEAFNRSHVGQSHTLDSWFGDGRAGRKICEILLSATGRRDPIAEAGYFL